MAATQTAPTQSTVVAGQSSALTPHTVLVCQNLEKYYGTRGNITKALDGINLSVARGEFIAIMGPSGSGKTTLLNCISTIDQVSAGHIFIDDQELSRLRGSERPAPVAAEDVRLEKPSAKEQVAADKATAEKAAASKPAAKPASKSSTQATANKAAKGFGMQLGRMGKMFSDFKDEFDKASK